MQHPLKAAAKLTLLAALFLRPTELYADQQIYVTDGDTIHVDGITYRLEGIDAPETKQSCLDTHGIQFRCGLNASKVLRELLRGQVINCRSASRDRYGRFLAHCLAGKVDINEEMVAQGYARAFTKYSGEYLADETEAKRAGLGFWAGEWQAPWDWRAEQLQANGPEGTCVIKGNISKKGKIYYLPFHETYSRVKINVRKGEQWFCDENEAIAAGWRRAD